MLQAKHQLSAPQEQNKQACFEQIPLFIMKNEDEQLLLNSPDADWYRILYYFPWKNYREYGAIYYNSLRDYNIKQIKNNVSEVENTIESKHEATQRILFDRPTISKTTPPMYQEKYDNIDIASYVNPNYISPGNVPMQIAGRSPKDFFAMFKSFIGVAIMGLPANPENVHMQLISNPAFARVCGFTPKNNDGHYRQTDVPSIRKIQQFDMIMEKYGIWEMVKIEEVKQNLNENVIQKENELVGDTTHYHAHSQFITVSYIDENGKEKKKSQSKVTKNCGCQDKENCQHPYVLCDDGAGTIVKSNGKMFFGHKASVIGFPKQGIPLDARAVTDGATHDRETIIPHLEIFFDQYPIISSTDIDRFLYDAAASDTKLKTQMKDTFEIELKASLNPRRKKTITENLPQGMEKITPYGNVICKGGHEMDYQGIRYETEKFIYQAPSNETGSSVCQSCQFKNDCCPNANDRRVINISFDVLPHIDSNDPPMAKRFKAIMTRRPSVERMIKMLKCDLSDDRLKKRGNSAFQAYLDKTMIAFHILLRN